MLVKANSIIIISVFLRFRYTLTDKKKCLIIYEFIFIFNKQIPYCGKSSV